MNDKADMLPPDALSKVDNEGAAEDMDYIIQPRGPGAGYVFRIKTPPFLRGAVDPDTGKPFGSEIRRGLKTRHLPEARKRRDVWLGRVRAFEAKAEGSDELYPLWTVGAAVERRAAILEQRRRGADQPDYSERTGETHYEEEDLAALTVDEVSRELDKPASRQSAPSEVIQRFASVALHGDLPISEALTRYLRARAPGSQQFKPLAQTTVVGLGHSVEYLKEHLGGDVGIKSVTKKQVLAFRTEFLPNIRSARTPDGLTQKTIDKHITLLRGIWDWARESMLLDEDHPDIWVQQRRVPRAKSRTKDVADFSAEQVTELLRAAERGTHKGDTLRLLLVTGCRANDVVSLTMGSVRADCSGFDVAAGKTENATRFISLIPEAVDLLSQRVVGKGGEDRMFPEWPLRPKTGKPSALSEWFTWYRRQVLGDSTDRSVNLHSLRHTWRTVARRAGVRESDINDLGGWAGERTSNRTYDHGLLESQLTETQNIIGKVMRESGYLEAF